MLQVLALGNLIVWGTILALKRLDKWHESQSLFDTDLDKFVVEDGWDTKALIQAFEEDLTKPPPIIAYDDDHSHYPDTIMCNGYRYKVCDSEDMRRWMQDKNIRMLKQEWNTIPFPEGEDLMYIDWFRMKGYSNDAAERLVLDGEKPWDYKDLC